MSVILGFTAVPIVRASDGSAPADSALTDYLHHHRLPAVGAQVSTGADGSRTVMLYGFVATPKGKSDAELRTRQFLNDSNVLITNRIIIDPTLLASNNPNSPNDVSEYQNYGTEPPASQPPAAPPPAGVGSMQAYQSQSQTVDPLNQANGLATSLMVLAPIVGGLLLYNALSGPSYSSPNYSYSPPPNSYHRGGNHHGHH